MWYIFNMYHKIEQSHYSIHVGARGRVVLPSEVRRTLGLKEGDRLILTIAEDGSIHLLSASTQAQRLKGLFKDLAPDRDLARELIEQRREESQRESLE